MKYVINISATIDVPYSNVDVAKDYLTQVLEEAGLENVNVDCIEEVTDEN